MAQSAYNIYASRRNRREALNSHDPFCANDSGHQSITEAARVLSWDFSSRLTAILSGYKLRVISTNTYLDSSSLFLMSA